MPLKRCCLSEMFHLCSFQQQFEWLDGMPYKLMQSTKSDWVAIRKWENSFSATRKSSYPLWAIRKSLLSHWVGIIFKWLRRKITLLGNWFLESGWAEQTSFWFPMMHCMLAMATFLKESSWLYAFCYSYMFLYVSTTLWMFNLYANI